MPPPPPPSKSYLLVIDSDSSDEDEDSYRIHHRDTVTVTPNPVLARTSTPLEMNGRRRPHQVSDNEEDEEEEELIHVNSFDSQDICSSPRTTSESPASQDDGDEDKEPQKLTKNQKKKRSRRRNKKKSKPCQRTNPRISFSTVSTRIYPRAFSQVSVPADGGWPLGMELEPLDIVTEELALEEFEAHKQQKLKERWEHLLQVQAVDEKILAQMTTRPPTGEPFALETRQWDYCYKMKNPLFGALSEDQRRDIFLESESENGEGSFPAKGRARSNSVTDHGHGGSSPKRKGRSSSFGHAPEQFSETYNQVYVHHVRSDLEKLRIERTTSGATGCTCRKLSVYVPPKDGGGKKAQHRRLKPSKLREELKKRNLYDESKSRETLEQILHDAVEKEPCCGTADCFCHRNGLDCQADACSCWHDSHVHTKTNVRHLSVQTIKQRCGNPLGTVVVDNDAIDTYRVRVLEASMCQFITTGQ